MQRRKAEAAGAIIRDVVQQAAKAVAFAVISARLGELCWFLSAQF